MWLAQNRGARRPHRTLPALLALALLLAALPCVPGLAVSGPTIVLSGSGHNSGPGSWAPTSAMTTSGLGATLLLPKGQAFVLSSSGAQLYDQATARWSVTCGITTTNGGSATLLPDGQVLVAGGAAAYVTPSPASCTTSGVALHTMSGAGAAQHARSEGKRPGHVTRRKPSTWPGLRPRTAPHGPPPPPVPLCSAELYNPRSGAWASTGPMATCRFGHTATLLPTGQVLVTGGNSTCDDSGCKVASNAELYDPHTKRWSSTGSMTKARADHTALLLRTGRVLVVGLDGSAELYDPRTGRWTTTGSMSTAHTISTATLLPGGQVLVVGGRSTSSYLTRAELYNPATGAWTRTSSLHEARAFHTATLLRDGRVLVAGGEVQQTIHRSSTELYGPHTGTWAVTGPLAAARDTHTATLLSNGQVLVTGGCCAATGNGSTLDSAELYQTAP